MPCAFYYKLAKDRLNTLQKGTAIAVGIIGIICGTVSASMMTYNLIHPKSS
jgi:hypothetical protein